MASQNTTTRGDDRLSKVSNRFGWLGRLFAAGRSEDAAGQKKEPRSFSSLPAEIRVMIYGYIEPRFFQEDVSRLTVNREWYHYALLTMYRELDWSRMVHPQAAGAILLLGSDFRNILIKRQMRKWTLDLDSMFQSRQFTPVDYDLPGQPDMAQRRRDNPLNPRVWASKSRIPSPGQMTVGLRSVHPPNIDVAAKQAGKLVRMLCQHSSAAEEIEIVIRKPWGIHRGAVMTFEKELASLDGDVVDWRPKGLGIVRLDLAGLARRLNRWPGKLGRFEHGARFPIFVFDEVNSGRGYSLSDDFSRLEEDIEPEPYTERHACRFVRRVLMASEVAEVRTRSFCPEMLRVWVTAERREWYLSNWPDLVEDLLPDPDEDDPEQGEVDPEPGLPRLKELTVNMVMPFGRFRHDQVVHCDARDCLLSREAHRHYAALATDVATVEIERFARRLEEPRKVILRWTEASQVDGSGPPVHWELDALTGQRRKIKVDLNGEFIRYLTDDEEWAAARNEAVEELVMDM